MLQQILEVARASSYDFRLTANPLDPLRNLFEEWVPYYRLKWAIARVLQPTRILEIGIRHGYSALAFLDACPEASYTGLDIDAEYGGVVGAMEWARAATAAYSANFFVGDPRKMDRLPGDMYDLVHVDGRQNHEEYLHDLEISLNQAKFIIAGSCLWNRQNFESSSEFLYRNRNLIEYYGVIPGDAGNALIKVGTYSGAPIGSAQSSESIRETYTEEYYLTDCGGFDSFKRYSGAVLADGRLRSVADIASLARRGRALDMGCGRGEVCLALARQGFAVTAVDYSQSAIDLARGALAAADDSALNVTFHCDDVNCAPLSGTYDAVVASDVIEHLMPAELDRLYARIAEHLVSEGLFVVHTYPNLWFYRYEYARRLRAARAVGAYLPSDPRTRFEKLMHINEQSPRVMLRQLQSHFPHVLLWFAGGELRNPAEYLMRKPGISEMRAASDLFAVASHAPIDPTAIANALKMDAARKLKQGDVALRILRFPDSVTPGMTFSVEVQLVNHSTVALKSYPPYPVSISYHWLDSPTGQYVTFEGARNSLYPALRGGTEERYEALVIAPTETGEFCLRMTLLQEFIQWFDQPPLGVFADAIVVVK